MKIDTTKIEGYANMSAEDKVKAFEAFEYEDNSSEMKKYKDRIDELTGEISKAKKEAKAKEDAEKGKKDEGDRRFAELEEKYNELMKKSTVSEYTAKYLSLGWSKELAAETAQAQADGDLDKVFNNMSKANADLEKKVKAEVVKGTPKPDDKGEPKIYKSRDEIMKIKDTAERQQAIKDNIELFN